MKTILFLFLLSFTSVTAICQAGQIDPSFSSGIEPNNYVAGTAIQPDGKILIVGGFTDYNGISRNRIARLNQDGTLDLSFNPGSGANEFIQCLALQTDGKVIIGGWLFEYDGHPVGRIARLNSDGSLDQSFTTGYGFDGDLLSIKIQPDGKILCGGFQSTYNGDTCSTIARLNPDGTLDQTFDSGAGPNLGVHAIDIRSNGKIVIGGFFNEVNGIPKNRIAQLDTDGSLDLLYDCGNAANDDVRYLKLQADGKLLAGSSSLVNTGTGSFFRRFNLDGSLDATFTSPFATLGITGITIRNDDKILVGGPFVLTQLNPDGSTDYSFSCGSGPFVGIESISIQSDENIIIGGSFRSYNGTKINCIARVLNQCPPESFSISTSACDEYVLNGETYTSAGQYQTVFPNCSDSLILTINLTILSSSFTSLTEESCGDYLLNGITYSSSGVYQQILQNQFGCDSTINLDLSITQHLEPVIIDNNGTLQANLTGSYQWMNCSTDELIPGANNQDFSPTENGIYSAILTNGNCSDTSNCLTVDYLELISSDVQVIIHPNPTTGKIFFEQFEEGTFLQISDVHGRLIKTIQLIQNESISIEEYTPGIYFFHLKHNDESTIYPIVKY